MVSFPRRLIESVVSIKTYCALLNMESTKLNPVRTITGSSIKDILETSPPCPLKRKDLSTWKIC